MLDPGRWRPSVTTWDCRSRLPGNDEECVIEAPVPDTYHLMVRARTPFSGVHLRVTYLPGDE